MGSSFFVFLVHLSGVNYPISVNVCFNLRDRFQQMSTADVLTNALLN